MRTDNELITELAKGGIPPDDIPEALDVVRSLSWRIHAADDRDVAECVTAFVAVAGLSGPSIRLAVTVIESCADLGRTSDSEAEPAR